MALLAVFHVASIIMARKLDHVAGRAHAKYMIRGNLPQFVQYFSVSTRLLLGFQPAACRTSRHRSSIVRNIVIPVSIPESH